MGIFGLGKKPDPKEAVRDMQRKMRVEMRQLDRQIHAIEREEMKVQKQIKEAAKKGDRDVCVILAKSILQSRKAVSKIHVSKAQINSVIMCMQQQLSAMRMAGSIQQSTEVMKAMQQLVKVPEIMKTMREMAQEMTKVGIIEEMIEDTMEGMEPEELEEEAQHEVDKVLYEITAGELGKAPAAIVDTIADDHEREAEVAEVDFDDMKDPKMAPPAIYGEPKISHDADNGSVVLEVMATGADAEKTKWFLEEKELLETESYKFSNSDQGGNRKLYKCEIKDFDKSLAGVYKAKFFNAEGENHATFTVQAGNAPDFHDKPHIVQRDGGNIICIKVRAKSHLEMKADWFKDDKPIKANDRIKFVTKKDDKDKDGFQFLLEIHGPQKDDEAKYKCVVKNIEGQNQQSLNLVFG